MKQMNLQFHATYDDIYELINSIIIECRYSIKGIMLFPKYTIEKYDFHNEIKKYDYIVISKNSILEANNNYEFMRLQDNNLIIEIGISSSTEIKESSISIFSEGPIDSDFKKVINKFKKSMHKGAWGVGPNPNSARVFYKNHLYTERAKIAYEQGVKLCAYAGWTYFELSDGKE